MLCGMCVCVCDACFGPLGGASGFTHRESVLVRDTLRAKPIAVRLRSDESFGGFCGFCMLHAHKWGNRIAMSMHTHNACAHLRYNRIRT